MRTLLYEVGEAHILGVWFQDQSSAVDINMEAKLVLGAVLFLLFAGLCSAQCPLDDVIGSNSQCQYASTTNSSDCVGLTCSPSAPFQGLTATFKLVDPCIDPVQVELTIMSGEQTTAPFRERFSENEIVQFSSDVSVGVEISRNATHLDFQATIFHNVTDSVALFPESLIPLNPDECMCSSMESLAVGANSLHPLIESDCATTRNCTGVRCRISVESFGLSINYYVEVVVLSCENAVEFLVENQNFDILVADRFQGPGNETKFVIIDGIPFTIEVDILVKPYSMVLQAFLETLLGRLDLTPQRNINLDRTQCNIPEFPTVALPTRLPPPQPVASNAPAVCVSLNKIAIESYTRTTLLRCELRDMCESGLACILDIARNQYKVDINITSNSVSFAVVSMDGRTRYGGGTNVNSTVSLPIPENTALAFGQNLENEMVGFMLQLRVSFLTSGPQTEELIPYTVISFPSSTNVTAIVVPIVFVVLLLIAIVVAVLVVVFCFCRGKPSDAPFDFQRMSDLQEKEIEKYVEGDIENPFPRTPVGDQPTKGGGEAKADLGTGSGTTM